MSCDTLSTAQTQERQVPSGPDVPSAEELFCGKALEQLRGDRELGDLVQSLRRQEARVASRIEGMDPSAVCRACIDVVAGDMREEGLSVPEVALSDPASFFQATRELPFVPSTAGARRRFREMARTIMLASRGSLQVPAGVDDFHDAWEQAMLGEPRLSESFPSSRFRTGPIALRGPLPELELLHECMDAGEVPGWLEALVGLLADDSIAEELRAACGLCLHDWIHPFSDGNGHVGRMVALAVLSGSYTLPTLALFSRELVMRRSVAMQQFSLLRSRETDVCGFCAGLLAQVEDAQALALRTFG